MSNPARTFKAGDRVISVAGKLGTVLKDVSKFQARPAYQVRWDNGAVSWAARPGFVIAGPAPKPGFLCVHDHLHRTQAAMDRCEDGRSGAATGSRDALR